MSWDDTAPSAVAAAAAPSNDAPSALSAASAATGAGPSALSAASAGIAFTGDTTAEDADVVTVDPAADDLEVGMTVRGAGIPDGATIAALEEGIVTLSIPATATAEDVDLLAFAPPEQLTAATGQTGTAPTALSAASAPDNTAPSALDAAAGQSGTAPSAIAAAAGQSGDAPSAIDAAAAPSADAPTALDVAASGTDSPAFPIGVDQSQISLPTMAASFTPAFIELTGGGSSLSTLTASVADATAGRIVQGVYDGELKSFQVRTGTDEQAEPGIIRPSNFDAEDNAVLFVML